MCHYCLKFNSTGLIKVQVPDHIIAHESNPQIFQESRIHLHILGARRVTWCKFYTKDPQLWGDLGTSLLHGTICLVHVGWYLFLYVRKKSSKMLKTLRTNIQNLVMWATRHSGFIPPLQLWNYTRSLNCLIVLLTQVPENLQAAHFVFHAVDLWHIWQESLLSAGLSPLPPHDDNKQTGPITQHILNY